LKRKCRHPGEGQAHRQHTDKKVEKLKKKKKGREIKETLKKEGFHKAFGSKKVSENLPKLCCNISEKENGRINVNILWGKHKENLVF